MKKFLENEIGLLLLLVLFAISAFVVPDFFTVENIQNFLVASAIVGSLSIGAALVLLSGNIDLTPGSIVALCSVLAAYFSRFSIVLAVIRRNRQQPTDRHRNGPAGQQGAGFPPCWRPWG